MTSGIVGVIKKVAEQESVEHYVWTTRRRQLK